MRGNVNFRPFLVLRVRRSDVVHDTMRQLSACGPEDLKKPLKVGWSEPLCSRFAASPFFIQCLERCTSRAKLEWMPVAYQKSTCRCVKHVDFEQKRIHTFLEGGVSRTTRSSVHTFRPI